MSRCVRCDACQSMWDAPLCSHCNYPEADTRSRETILYDDAWMILDDIRLNLINLTEEELENVVRTLKALPQL